MLLASRAERTAYEAVEDAALKARLRVRETTASGDPLLAANPAELPELPDAEDPEDGDPRAEEARQIANDLSHPDGWKGPAAAQLWEQRPSITSAERANFLATVTEQRAVACAAL